MRRITGIGGIFFKTKDPKQTREWYAKHLGLNADEFGANFQWRKEEDPSKKGFTLLSMFSEKSEYFGNSGQPYMINFRVENLEELVPILKSEGVNVVDEIETYEYGKFVHILDNDGNKIELWEAYDDEYDKIIGGSLNKT